MKCCIFSRVGLFCLQILSFLFLVEGIWARRVSRGESRRSPFKGLLHGRSEGPYTRHQDEGSGGVMQG